jgi:GNAT superfamily N-acetyltransferase
VNQTQALRPASSRLARPSVTLRPARATDAADLSAMLATLSVQSAFHRFLAGLGHPSRQLVARLLRRDARHGAWLAMDHRWFVVGHVQWAVADGVADLGVVVADQWQRRGVGRRLIQAALSEAAVAGATALQVDVHRDNGRVLRLVRTALPRAAVTQEGPLLTFRAPLADALSPSAVAAARRSMAATEPAA